MIKIVFVTKFMYIKSIVRKNDFTPFIVTFYVTYTKKKKKTTLMF